MRIPSYVWISMAKIGKCEQFRKLPCLVIWMERYWEHHRIYKMGLFEARIVAIRRSKHGDFTINDRAKSA